MSDEQGLVDETGDETFPAVPGLVAATMRLSGMRS